MVLTSHQRLYKKARAANRGELGSPSGDIPFSHCSANSASFAMSETTL